MPEGRRSEPDVIPAEPLTGFHTLAKPASAACNLACRYCYYLHRPDREPGRRMRAATLAAFVQQTIEAQAGAGDIAFSWQGGEPTLAGLAFFREAVALQARHQPPGVRIVNALQTNGTLIDAEWTAFLAEHGFLVGVSIDGPARMHDPLRRHVGGGTSHAQVVRAIERLARANVEFNTLTVVHSLNHAHGHEVYRFLRRIGSRFMQFIPLVERLRPDGAFAAPPPQDPDAVLAPWTAPREGFGRFLCDAFDDWLAHDVGRIYIQLVEERVATLSGRPAALCVFASDCTATPMLEANGDLYSCDHYGYPAWHLGNIGRTPIAELLGGAFQRAFGEAKREPLPQTCLGCPDLHACWGGCPKHRFVPAPQGVAENYLCPSYRRFFAHTQAALASIAEDIVLQRGARR